MSREVETKWRGKPVSGLSYYGMSIGRAKSYFYTLAHEKNRDKWEFLQILHEDPCKAVRRYEEIFRSAINRIDEILWEIEEDPRMKLYEFSRFLYEKGVYERKHSFSNVAGHIPRNPVRDIRVKTFERLALVSVFFEEYKARKEKR